MASLCGDSGVSISVGSVCVYGFEMLSLKGAYFVCSAALVAFLYGYIAYLYRSQRSGRVDYEKYGMLAINDSLDDRTVEPSLRSMNELDSESMERRRHGAAE